MSAVVANEPLVSMRNIHVRYENVEALRGVDFDLYPGEIHAIIGEHRAGKSSLVGILNGTSRKHRGAIRLGEREVESLTPTSSLKAGIGTVYQETALIPGIDAVENIFSGQMLRRRLGLVDWHRMERSVCASLEDFGLTIDIHEPVYKLPPAQQYMIEFVRATLLSPRVIILDELSNKLTPAEMKFVYRKLFDLREKGAGIIYISHDLDEVLKLADRVTILRNGYRRGTEHTRNLDKYRLFQLTYSYSLDRERLQYSKMKFLLLKRYLEGIVNYLPVAAIIVDSTERIQLSNLAVSDLLHVNPDGILDAPIGEVLHGFAPEVVQQVQEALSTRRHIHLREVELGDQGQFDLDVVPLLDDENSFLGTAILAQNVTIDRSMRDYLVQSEKMATVAEVAVGVAHEINNPLFIIKNYLQLIMESIEDTATVERLLKIDKEATRIMDTVATLLSFSRVPRQTQPTIDLCEVVNEVATLVEHQVKQKNINLVLNVGPESALIDGDENKLKQVVMNLLMNSIDAVLENGDIYVTLRESAEAEAPTFELRVRDTGYGIPTDVADSIFDPFFSTKVTKKNTGLGLSICRNIVEDHGGEIGFTSSPGAATEFVVRLPASAS